MRFLCGLLSLGLPPTDLPIDGLPGDDFPAEPDAGADLLLLVLPPPLEALEPLPLLLLPEPLEEEDVEPPPPRALASAMAERGSSMGNVTVPSSRETGKTYKTTVSREDRWRM